MKQFIFKERTFESVTRSQRRAMGAVFVAALCAVPLAGQIKQISVCAPGVDGLPQNGPNYTCKAGSDTQKIVMSPVAGQDINRYVQGGITDEHSSVLPPGTVRLANGSWNTDYLFFVASGVGALPQPGPDIGLLVLSGAGPRTLNNIAAWDPNFQWTMDFASRDGYGNYNPSYPGCNSSGNCSHGTVFLPPIVQGNCPLPGSLATGPLPLDNTFDLDYAAAGSVVPDPSGPAGSMLMIYEGVNVCGSAGKVTSIGLATSDNYGRTWPTYRGSPFCNGAAGRYCDAFQFYDLPFDNPDQGPRQEDGATGAAVCKGNDCSVLPLDSYGRYRILESGGAEPSAFVDHGYARSSSPPYVYTVVHCCSSGIGLARAQLGVRGKLQFETFNGLNQTGQPVWVNAANTATPQETSIIPSAAGGDFKACEDSSQSMGFPQLSYYPPTGEYVLTFVCSSPNDPALGKQSNKAPTGAAWFWSKATDLGLQDWSTPKQIYGTWNTWQDNPPCHVYNGWYPTFMSLGQAPGVLSQNGYAFYLYGDLGACAFGRQYASRAFTISTALY